MFDTGFRSFEQSNPVVMSVAHSDVFRHMAGIQKSNTNMYQGCARLKICP